VASDQVLEGSELQLAAAVTVSEVVLEEQVLEDLALAPDRGRAAGVR